MKSTEVEKLIKKLDRPPAGANWVRLVGDNELSTAKSILSFLRGSPRFSYIPASKVIRDRIELGIDRESAAKAGCKTGNPLGRSSNLELVNAFYDYDQIRGYSSSNTIAFDTEYFQISRDISVPIKPLSIIRENGKFVPIFLIGWTENLLSIEQRRLLMTIIEDAFLSLTDFQSSPAEVLFFPKVETLNGKQRITEVWKRGDYDLLSDAQLADRVDLFMKARELARSELLTTKIEDELPVVGGDRDDRQGKLI